MREAVSDLQTLGRMISAATTPEDLYFTAGTSWDLTPQQFRDMKIELLSKIGGMLSVLAIAGGWMLEKPP